MADGKVMQKYYPPDFDPEALRRNKDVLRAIQRERGGGVRKAGRRMMEMRMMFPFTLQCENCKDFVYVGTKFNSKVEKVRNQDYLGIAIWRFYGRCPHCRHQLVLRTDPKNTDYILESGGTRTYDSNRDVHLAEEALEQAKAQEDEGDAVKALEKKSYSAAGELKSLEILEELKRINKRLMGRPDKLSDFTLNVLNEMQEREEDALDEQEMREARDLIRDRQFEPDGVDENRFDKKGKGDEISFAPTRMFSFGCGTSLNSSRFDPDQRTELDRAVDQLLGMSSSDEEPANKRQKNSNTSGEHNHIRRERDDIGPKVGDDVCRPHFDSPGEGEKSQRWLANLLDDYEDEEDENFL